MQEFLINPSFEDGQPFNPGGFTTQMSLPGWAQYLGGKVPPVALEVIQGPFGGDPAHGVPPLNAVDGVHWLDSQASPGGIHVQQAGIPTFANTATLTELVALQNVSGLHDDPANHLQFVWNGTVVQDISMATFTDKLGHIDYNHFVQFSQQVTSVPNDGSHNTLVIQEVGPSGLPGSAVPVNVGFGIDAVHLIGSPIVLPSPMLV